MNQAWQLDRAGGMAGYRERDHVEEHPRARSGWHTVRLLARQAAGEAVHGWLAPTLAGVYLAAGALITFVGLSAGGLVMAQDFGRTALSLLAVTLWVVPLAAVLAGALTASDDGELLLLLVQPVSWRAVFLARWLGVTGAVVAAILLAWGTVGLLVGVLAGWRDVGGYVGVGLVAVGAAAVGTAIGAATAARVGRRGPSIIVALAVWFALAVAWDFVAIGAIAVVAPLSESPWGPAVLAVLNPFDALRVLGTLAVGGRHLAFGAVTASLEQSGTARLPLAMAASVLAWTAGALLLGARWFRRRDR